MTRRGENPTTNKRRGQGKKEAKDNVVVPILRKGLASKKMEIEKLIVQSRMDVAEIMDQSCPKICLPRKLPDSTMMNAASSNRLIRKPDHVSRQAYPKQVQPGLPYEPAYLILDIRREGSDLPLIRLPYEPDGRGALRNFQPKGTFPFFKLPGELRNKIYNYSIERNHYVIEWVCSNNKSKTLTYWIRKSNAQATGRKPGPYLHLEAAAAHRRRALDSPGGKVRQPLPSDYFGRTLVAPLLVCKQMHKEASSVFYSKSTFDFHGLRALDHFLDKLQPTAKTSLTSLVIKYRAYGHPEETINEYWKTRHDHRWSRLCWRISDECISLTDLSLNVFLNKSPVSFCSFDDAETSGLGTEWILPLLAFQGINIKRCWTRIHCSVKDRSVLELESWKVRKEIVGKNWDEEAERKRDSFGRDIKPKRDPKESRRS